MANREQGEVGVEVAGRRYTLRPSFDAICELEGLVDKSFEDVVSEIKAGRFSGLRAVIWCLLQDQHGAEIKTLKDASRWIEKAGGIDGVLTLINDVFELNTEPTTEHVEDRPTTAQDAMTGTPSLPALVEQA